MAIETRHRRLVIDECYTASRAYACRVELPYLTADLPGIGDSTAKEMRKRGIRVVRQLAAGQASWAGPLHRPSRVSPFNVKE